MALHPLRAEPVADRPGAAWIPPAPLQEVVEMPDNLGLELELLRTSLRAAASINNPHSGF